MGSKTCTAVERNQAHTPRLASRCARRHAVRNIATRSQSAGAGGNDISPGNLRDEALTLCLRGGRRVLLAKFVDAATGVHDFLLAGVKRMAVRADFYLQVVSDGRASLELIPASASDGDVMVFGMNAGFHRNLVSLRRQNRCALYISEHNA